MARASLPEYQDLYLRMLHQPAELYRHATNDGRGDLNQAFFERLYLDDHNVVDAVLTDALIEMSAVALVEEAVARYYGRLQLGGKVRKIASSILASTAEVVGERSTAAFRLNVDQPAGTTSLAAALAK